VTQNHALAVVPRQTIHGKITDGSGHGWPLYAKITLDGVPGGPINTDTRTGAYTVDLPQGNSYQLTVATRYPGYETISRAVTVGNCPQTVDIAVPVDAKAERTPGYAVTWNGPIEAFNSSTTPSGWRVVNAAGTTEGWRFDDPGGVATGRAEQATSPSSMAPTTTRPTSASTSS
jgi:hypothetical protein